MTGDAVPTSIVDKNGKQTTVHKKPNLKPDLSRLSPFAVLPPARISEHLHPSNLTFEEIQSEWDDFLDNKHRWKSTEKETRKAVQAVFLFIDNPETPTDVPIPPANKSFREVRNYMTGLHFAKEMLTDDERTMLWWGESLLTKIDGESASGFVY